MAIIIIIYIAIFYIIVALVIGLYQKSTNAICLSKKRLDGKTVIVTGGTLGMGFEIAKDLADRGARTIIACPYVDEGETAKKNIIQDTENEQVVFKLLDLSSIASIRQFVKDIYATEERLDLLMNNAGIGTVEEFITKDGMSVIMQVNYFGQFLLTILLLPLLKKSGTNSDPARIVNTSSSFHWFGFINFARLNDIKFWYPLFLYANSKLCLLSFSYELTKKLREPNVVVNSVDPGFVGTGIFCSVGRFFGGIIRLALFVLSKTPWEGAQTALHVALDKKAGAVSGKYFRNCNLSVARKVSCDDKTAKQLWEESVRLVGLSDEELNQCLIY